MTAHESGALLEPEYCGHCFRGMDLSNRQVDAVRFEECRFERCNFSAAASFTGSELHASVFRNTNLQEADFTAAIGYDIDFQSNDIRRAKFSLPEAVSLLRALDIDLID